MKNGARSIGGRGDGARPIFSIQKVRTDAAHKHFDFPDRVGDRPWRRRSGRSGPCPGDRRYRRAGGRCQRRCRAEEGVGEIVVTAQRRSENLQDIPLSVATIDDETLAAINSGGADIRGLSGRVPSLNIESSFGRTFPRFYIRGLGNTDFDLNASQPVSLVYDDVVLENPILKGFPAFDVDRIEVLRGPQGTLFGRNTPAGIVKFDTVKPGQGPQLCADQLRHLLHDQRRGRGRRPS